MREDNTKETKALPSHVQTPPASPQISSSTQIHEEGDRQIQNALEDDEVREALGLCAGGTAS